MKAKKRTYTVRISAMTRTLGRQCASSGRNSSPFVLIWMADARVGHDDVT